MAREAPPELLREVAAEPELRQLIQALALSNRFHFYIVTCRAPIVAHAVFQVLEAEASEKREQAVRLVRLDPYIAHFDPRKAIEPKTLLKQVLEPLVEPSKGDAVRGVIHVVDGSRARSRDTEAWGQLFQRMNERRNVIAKRLRGELLLCIQPELETVFARSAPDFWSIRSSMTVNVHMAPPMMQSDPTFLDEEPTQTEWTSPHNPITMIKLPEPTSEPDNKAREFTLDRAQAVNFLAAAEPLIHEAATARDDARAAASRSRAFTLLQQAIEARRRVFDLMEMSSRGADEVAMASYELAKDLIELGDVALEDGRPGKSMEAYREAVGIMRRLAEREPTHVEWQRDLSICLGKLGNVYQRLGELDQALSMYREVVEVRRWLVKRDPALMEWQRGLASGLSRLGDMYFERDELEQALAAYEEGLDIRRSLVDWDPGRAQWQRDLAVSLGKIGDVLRKRREPEKALSSYENAVRILEQVVESNPERIPWARNLVVNLDKVGEMYVERGELDRALAAYEEALEVMSELSKRDDRRVEWRRDLALIVGRIGSVHQRGGALKEAERRFEEALSILRQLLEHDPGRPQWREDYARCEAHLNELRRGHHMH